MKVFHLQSPQRPAHPATSFSVVGWIIFLLLLPIGTHSQQLPIRTYDRSNGLLSDYVTCIEQDNAGFIWFGTDRGLSRYDGKDFLNYTQADGLPDPFITCLYPDTDGTLWFGTYQGGAVHLTETGFTVFDSLSGLRSNYVKDIMRDSDGAIFFHTEGGPACLINDSVHTLPVAGRGEFILRLRDGTLIHPQGEGFVRLRADEDRGLFTEPIEFSGSLLGFSDVFRFLAGYQAKNGDIFFHYGGGLFKLQSQPDGTFGEVETLSTAGITDIAEDGEGNIWAATGGTGLLIFTDQTVKYLSTNEGLPFPRLEAVLVDYEGNVWTSIFGQGVNKLTSRNVLRYTKLEGLHHDNAQLIFQDSEHRVWIGTQLGLNVIDGPLLQKIPNKSGSMDGVRAVTVNDDGKIYVGTIRSLFGPARADEFMRGTPVSTQFVSYGVSGLAGADPSTGFDLVVGTFGNGISLANADTVLENAPHGGLPLKMIEGVIPGSTGAWLLTRNEGALRVNRQGIEAFNIQKGLPSNSVFSIYESRDSRPDSIRIWIGMENALSRYREGSVRSFTAENGLRGSPVIGIFPLTGAYDAPPQTEEGEEPLLILTPEAIHIMRGDSLELVEALSFLAEGGAALNSGSYDPVDRKLWLATTRGVYVMDLTQKHLVPVPPKIAITSVRAGSRTIHPVGATNGEAGELSLPDLSANQNDITIGYAGLSYINENGVLYQTKLDPVDQEFSDPGPGRSNLFRSLSDGEYIFHVRAVNERNVVSERPAIIRFRIQPPFWKRWWFIGGCVLIGLAFAAVGTRAVFVRKMRRTLRDFERRQEIQNERERISRDLHDHVGGQLASLISGLELANRYDETNEAKRRSVLLSLREDARLSMEQLRETIWALQASALTLAGFCIEVRNYGNRHFRYLSSVRFTVESEGDDAIVLHPHEVLELFRIVQEALANALKHAHPEKTTVSFRSSPDGTLTLSVINDGAVGGKDPGHPWAGRGLRNMKQRIGSLGGSIEWVLNEEGIFRVTASYVRKGDSPSSRPPESPAGKATKYPE